MPDIIDPLIPPYRFERVQSQLYRGGYPKQRNFRFLRRQRLKTILSLIPGDRDNALSEFCEAEGITRITVAVESPNENVTVTDSIVSQCLALVADPARAPLYIHCLDGSNVTGVVIMCLRKLQLWRVASYQNEYLRFEQDGEIIPEESEFVETYTGKGLVLPNPYAQWLWPGRPLPSAPSSSTSDASSLPFQNGVHPVMRHVKIRQRMSTDICQAAPLVSLSRSATEPILLDGDESGRERQRSTEDSQESTDKVHLTPASASQVALSTTRPLAESQSGRSQAIPESRACRPQHAAPRSSSQSTALTGESASIAASEAFGATSLKDTGDARAVPPAQGQQHQQHGATDVTRLHPSFSTGALSMMAPHTGHDPLLNPTELALETRRPLSMAQGEPDQEMPVLDMSAATAAQSAASDAVSAVNDSDQNTAPLPKLGETWKRIHFELRKHLTSRSTYTSSSATPEPLQMSKRKGQDQPQDAIGDLEAPSGRLSTAASPERSGQPRVAESSTSIPCADGGLATSNTAARQVNGSGSGSGIAGESAGRTLVGELRGGAGKAAGLAFVLAEGAARGELSADTAIKEVALSLLVKALAIEGLGM